MQISLFHLRTIFSNSLMVFILFITSCNRDSKINTITEQQVSYLDNDTPESYLKKLANLPYPKKDSSFRINMHKLYNKGHFNKLFSMLNCFSGFCTDSNEVKALQDFYKSAFTYYRLNNDSARCCIDEIVNRLQKTGCKKELASALSLQADLLSSAGEFYKAIQKRYDAIDILQNDSSQKKELYKEIGQAGIDYYHSRNFNKADILIDSARHNALAIGDSVDYAMFTSSRSVLSFGKKQYAEAIRFAEEALAIYIPLKDTIGIAEAYNNMALPYIALKEWSKARRILQKANQLFEQVKAYRQLSISFSNIANCLLAQNKTDSALFLFTKAYGIAASHFYLNEMRLCLKSLWKANKAAGKLAPALIYLERFSKLKDSTFRLEKEKTIQEIYSRHQVEQKEQRIAALQKDQQLQIQKRNNLWLTLVAIALASSLAIGTILFRNLRSRQKLDMQLHLNEVKIKQLTLQMESNHRDLANYIDLLIQKSKMIEVLEEQLSKLNEKNKEADTFKTLSNMSHLRIITDDDWLNFKAYFEKAYPGFIPKLNQTHPTLTPAELRMFLLIKINISSSEVASVLGISIESAKKSRYRLKKKLNLPESADLADYIQNSFRL